MVSRVVGSRDTLHFLTADIHVHSGHRAWSAMVYTVSCIVYVHVVTVVFGLWL